MAVGKSCLLVVAAAAFVAVRPTSAVIADRPRPPAHGEPAALDHEHQQLHEFPVEPAGGEWNLAEVPHDGAADGEGLSLMRREAPAPPKGAAKVPPATTSKPPKAVGASAPSGTAAFTPKSGPSPANNISLDGTWTTATGSKMVIAGTKVTGPNNYQQTLTIKSGGRRVEMTFQDKNYWAILVGRGGLNWNDGDLWLRPVDCQWGDWSVFGACGGPCGKGMQQRTRDYSYLQENGGAPCTGAKEDCQRTDDCNRGGGRPGAAPAPAPGKPGAKSGTAATPGSKPRPSSTPAPKGKSGSTTAAPSGKKDKKVGVTKEGDKVKDEVLDSSEPADESDDGGVLPAGAAGLTARGIPLAAAVMLALRAAVA